MFLSSEFAHKVTLFVWACKHMGKGFFCFFIKNNKVVNISFGWERKCNVGVAIIRFPDWNRATTSSRCLYQSRLRITVKSSTALRREAGCLLMTEPFDF